MTYSDGLSIDLADDKKRNSPKGAIMPYIKFRASSNKAPNKPTDRAGGVSVS